MSKNLFGEKIIKEDSIEIIYNGPSFDNKMEIKNCYIQLEAVENIIKDIIDTLKKTGKINFGSREAKIFLKLKRGSFGEMIQIVLTDPIVQDIIPGCVVALFSYFLMKKIKASNIFRKETNILKKDSKFKNNMKSVVSPINVLGDHINIVGNNNNVVIKQEQKEDFYKSLEEVEDEEILKNGEFEEELTGVVRKLDLDAFSNNYLGFNIDDGPSKIPTSIKGEFNLNEVKEIINEPVKIKALVKYKDNEIKHIEILHYEFLNKQEKLSF